MKRHYLIPLALLTILILGVTFWVTSEVKAQELNAPKPPRQVVSAVNFSWYATAGLRGYPGLLNGFVYASELSYPYMQEGFYTRIGTTFVGQTPALTQISGTCVREVDLDTMEFRGTLRVDDTIPWSLFHEDTEDTAVFNVTFYGQVFEFKITTIAPLGCNIKLETVP